MNNENEQNTDKLIELGAQSQIKLLTFELPKPEYQDIKIESIKRTTRIRDLVAEIFKIGWTEYQSRKQNQTAA